MRSNFYNEKMFTSGDDELVNDDDLDVETEEEPNEVYMSFACEDCDYRWELVVEEDEEEYEETQYCPMCGSANTTQI